MEEDYQYLFYVSPPGLLLVLSGENIAKLFRGNSFFLSAMCCHREYVVPLADIFVPRQLTGWAEVHVQKKKKKHTQKDGKVYSSIDQSSFVPDSISVFTSGMVIPRWLVLALACVWIKIQDGRETS